MYEAREDNMASLYDTNFLRNYIAYRNKQRLMGGQLDPNVIGSLAEGDLSARYANADNKRKLSLYEKSLTDAQSNADRNYNLSLQEMGLKKDALKANQRNSMMQGLAAIPQTGLAIYGIGKNEGWWGDKKKSNNSTNSKSIYDNFGTGYTPYDTLGNDISDYDWTYGDSVPDTGSGGSSGGNWFTNLFKWILGG